MEALFMTTAFVTCFYFLPGTVPAGHSSFAQTHPNLKLLIEKMESAYAEVENYQTKVHIDSRSTDGGCHTETFLYSFEKPDRIRIDFESPHSGLVLVYSDKNLKAVVSPFQWVPFFKLHLDPNSSLLDTPSGFGGHTRA
jgi:outer membrane lipoprotein-sorting protein